MKLTPVQVLNELDKLNKNVSESLRKKGIVPPKKESDGSVRIGKFKISKTSEGYYMITDQRNEVIITEINLPHTAAILANKLALGNFTDSVLLNLDKQYGHHSFNEQICKHQYMKNCQIKNFDRAEIIIEKYKTARLKKQHYKNQILQGFNKLMRVV